jgi:hypothetical protein
MLIFFVMLVVLLQTALCRQFWGAPRKQFGRDAQVYLISCPELHQQLAWGLFAGLKRSAEMCYKVLTIV